MRTIGRGTWATSGALVAVLAFGSGCECEAPAPADETTTTTASGGGAHPPADTPRIGRTEDGEEIVFAGRRPASAEPPDHAHLVREPTTPDPAQGRFSLEDAVEGMPVDGELVVEITSDMGTFFCDLHADRTPQTVANFIGLVRGLRPWWDARAATWRRTPYYRGLTFHRVMPGYLVQGGDYLGDGTGTVGYTLPYEHHETLSHDRAGRLAMATLDGPDTGGAQFYITDGPAPQLDRTATIFGTCRPEDVVATLARVAQSGSPDNRPLTPLRIARMIVRRVEGGAAAARPTLAERPPGEPEVGRGASPGPSEMGSMEALRARRRLAEEAMRREREALRAP